MKKKIDLNCTKVKKQMYSKTRKLKITSALL